MGNASFVPDYVFYTGNVVFTGLDVNDGGEVSMGRIKKALTKAEAYLRLIRKKEYDKKYRHGKYIPKKDRDLEPALKY